MDYREATAGDAEAILAHGASCVERELAGPFPGGGHAFSFRYAWSDLTALIHH